jgi:Phycobilisome protein
MTKSSLSEAVRELIQKARIVSFTTWQSTHPLEAIGLFQAADDEGRYLTDEDLQQIQQLVPENIALISVTKELRDRVTEIVDEARNQVLETFPNITQPAGGLYPPARADACWRDFWHFLRCITYGIAGLHTDYTSAEGLYYMELLYQELQVPLDAMVVGLEGIKAASLKRVEPEQQKTLAPYFDHLIDELKQFPSKTFGLNQDNTSWGKTSQ